MKTYTFTITIEEIEDKKPLANSILERLRKKEESMKRARDVNNKFRTLRFNALYPYLEQIKKSITDPLGLEAKICIKENYVHKDSIIISGKKLHWDINIRLYIENQTYKDDFGNYISKLDDFKMEYIISRGNSGTYSFKFESLEEMYKKCEEDLERMYLENL